MAVLPGLLALGPSASARAEDPPTLPGALPSLAIEVGPGGATERFAAHPSLPGALRAAALDAPLRISDWPVAPGDRRTVEVARHDVYAPDARIVAIGADGEKEVPRSPLLFFWGAAVGDPSRRVLVSLGPETGALGGLSVTPDGIFEIAPAPGGSRDEYRLAKPADPAGAGERTGGFACGGSLTHAEDVPPPAAALGEAATSALSSLHTATVAVDTDNELLSLKFANNTTSASNYVASLVAGMNVIYERDLFVRLLQGHTLLRLSSAADPWSQPSCPAWPASCSNTGGATSAQVNEVAGYWSSNYAAVPRALTMLLSGKQSSGNSASGIAYVNALCSGGSGYSFSQVFKFTGSTAAADVNLVAHELGHNFGSRHTHCYPTATTPIDQCYNGEAGNGCWAGTETCPAPFTITPVNGGPVVNVRGTLMSYCHVRPPGCSASPVFHPQTVAVIAPIVDSRVGTCVFPNVSAVTPTLTSVAPATGTTAGGTAVTLTGTGFQGGATVSFVDGARAVAAAKVTFVSSTRLDVVTPARAAGTTDVVVGNPTKRTATKPWAFTFVAGALVKGTKTVSGGLHPGGSLNYTIVLTNTGGSQPNAGGSDELTDVLPSSLTLASASASAGTATASPATNTVVWNGSIASGASVTVTILATVKGSTAVGAVVSNQGTVRYDGNGDGTNESQALTDDPGVGGASDPTSFVVAAPPSATGFFTLSPCRLVDTRAGDAPSIAAGAARTFTLAGKCGLPASARSVSLNVTVVAGTTVGNVVVYPGDRTAPTASTLNFAAGMTRANNAIVGLASNGTGTVGVKNNAASPVNLVLDVNGYFQ